MARISFGQEVEEPANKIKDFIRELMCDRGARRAMRLTDEADDTKRSVLRGMFEVLESVYDD